MQVVERSQRAAGALSMVGRVRRALIAMAGAAALVLPAGATAQTAEPLAAQAQPPLPAPVVAGDWPDPDVSLIDGSYYAVATAGGWSPTFQILRSTDLRSWSIGGSVFRRPPAWTKDSFWAPELAELPRGGYAFFYSAMPKRPWTTRADGTAVPYRGAKLRRGAKMVPNPARPWYCLGVATAPSPLGPWRDLGRPLRCTPTGTIDPTPVVDGDKLYLVYKEDGNAFRRPTPIVIQELAADGRRLLGEPRELLRNQPGSWERNVVEAPFFVRRPEGWTMFYSGALCCSPDCAYAVGVARATTLAGPWTRYPGNPILRSGNGWRCPGHVSVVGDHVAFHAYRSGTGFLAGRQMQIAPLTWRADGWPAIGDGRPLPPAAGGLTTAFDDAFAGRALTAGWEWPIDPAPRVRVGGGLRLTATREAGTIPDAATVGRRLGTDRYVATAVVSRTSLSGAEVAGLAVVRGGPFAIRGQALGIGVARNGISLWRRGGRGAGATTRTERLAGESVHVRIEATGRRYRLSFSNDGRAWKVAQTIARGPVDETARIALTVGGQRGASAHFTRATLVER
jgi:xylan 1,4-beta-xylosidase